MHIKHHQAGNRSRIQGTTILLFLLWVIVAILVYGFGQDHPQLLKFGAGSTVFQLVAIIAAILALAQLVKIFTQWALSLRGKPLAEARMVGRLYDLLAAIGIILAFASSFGKLGAFGALFAAFGGMLLGWSLQAPVSGFAAWVLVSVKRPFRPGDRIQFPNLGLTGDVKEIGLMYTVLDQVGGTIGSEEAVGRFILVPNAMLFSQVVINYTVLQESPYMLDEVVIRITYNSDWKAAEAILISAATNNTAEIIAATGVQPYIRSDMYDYGVYLRLRYQTRVNDRAEIAYKITRDIFTSIQNTPNVDMAIPYVYSNRAALEQRDTGSRTGGRNVEQIDISRIRFTAENINKADVEQVSRSIQQEGLLQPIIVAESEQSGFYDMVTGEIRLEAAKLLNWRTIPALVQKRRENGHHIQDGIPNARQPTR